MANEAVIVELLGNQGDPIRYGCQSGVAIAKGTLLKMSCTREVSGATATGDRFAGVAAASKTDSDCKAYVPVYTKGIFGMTIIAKAKPVHSGDPLKISGTNMVSRVDVAAEMSGAGLVGIALEPGISSEVIQVLVG